MKTVIMKPFGQSLLSELTCQEMRELCIPLKSLNFGYATREQAISYMNCVEQKLNVLHEITRSGRDFSDNSLKFDTNFVYYALIDMWQIINDYVNLKDALLYEKYAETNKSKHTCDDCKGECNKIDRCHCSQ